MTICRLRFAPRRCWGDLVRVGPVYGRAYHLFGHWYVFYAKGRLDVQGWDKGA